MIKNYLKIAWRNLWKHKGYSLLNILGLATGITACIIIMLFVFYEKSFDGIHSKNIYRLDEVQKFEGMVAPQKVALSMYPMGPTLKKDYPEILNFARISTLGKVKVWYNDKRLILNSGYYVDSTFLQMFDFQLLKGDKNLVLQKPNSVVLTEENAVKIFGNEDAIGKDITVYGGDTITFVVTGILANVPKTSHLQFDGLFSLSTFAKPDLMNNWGGNWMVTYLELSKNADVASLEKRFPDFLKRNMKEGGWKFYELFLQPLNEVHSNSTSITHDYQNYQKFDKNYTYVFSIIALIVLLIACINFMNLSTARSAGRAKEIGIRKASGSGRFQLGMQFLGESVMLSFFALLIALPFVFLLLPYVNELSQRKLEFSIFTQPALLLSLVCGAIVVGLISGLYPAAYLSSFNAATVLKGTIQTAGKKMSFRNILVVGQFAGAIFLMIATVLTVRQLNFMQKANIGFDRDQVITIPLGMEGNKNYQALKDALLSKSNIVGVTASRQKLGNNMHQTGVKFHGEGPVREMASSQVVVDRDYLTLYKIPLVAGRNFSKEGDSDNGKAYIVNETLAKELLKETPGKSLDFLIGKNFGFGGMDSAGVLIGVAKDFNFNSLHHKIETLCIFNNKDWGFGEMSIKVNSSKVKEAIADIQSTWKEIAPNDDFEYEFLDEHFEELYRADNTVSEIVGILAGLAIFISCLGLFGLASFSVEQRVKEIGVRKVLGASVSQIVNLLSMDFVKLVLVAFIIAVPLAWFAMNKWLEDYAYRIDIPVWVFGMTGVLAVAIALITVSFQSIKAALKNPVKSLRSE
ncbi:putative ABC transport system permease protein [Dyadobacter koreensis]|uniref:Putative ABC transport system permease protein n=1 Tax=Dyadobacter koreensis TaxID=408657 RepID=A0A1H6TY51_9BACT|nr:ABC transporter permease [Dyadobacter koreensis]SEI82177.1 putative ABC transport system permease protein [Dyadobacter koreensis]